MSTIRYGNTFLQNSMRGQEGLMLSLLALATSRGVSAQAGNCRDPEMLLALTWTGWDEMIC